MRARTIELARATRSREGDFARLERLVDILDRADEAFRSGPDDAREACLTEAISAVSALYGFLDVAVSPEASAHLAAVYDGFLAAIGAAYGGDVDRLTAARMMARAICFSLGPCASRRPTDGRLRRAA